jgi:hypothetical protein
VADPPHGLYNVHAERRPVGDCLRLTEDGPPRPRDLPLCSFPTHSNWIKQSGSGHAHWTSVYRS